MLTLAEMQKTYLRIAQEANASATEAACEALDPSCGDDEARARRTDALEWLKLSNAFFARIKLAELIYSQE